MPNLAMTCHALDRTPVGRVARNDLVNHGFMAAQTIALQNPAVALVDHDRLMKILERERLAVIPAVGSLFDVIHGKRMSQMAIIASGDRMVRPLGPAGVFVVHDVAVGAGRRIITQIAQAVGVVECERTQTDARAD